MRRDDGRGRPKQRGDHVGGIQPSLLSGPNDAREHLLGVGPSARPIAPATDFARDDGGAQGLFGAPVGGVEVGIDQEAEDGGQFHRQMPGEAVHVCEGARIVEHVEELVEEMPPRDRHAMRRDRAGRATVAHSERVLQDARDAMGLGPTRA